MNLTISEIFLIFVIYSFLGWCMEVCLTLYKQKKFVNRGFLIGPICPIYGVGVVLIMLLLNKYTNDPLVFFVMSVVLCSILEYFTGYIMEKMFKARWWDYSNKKYNINGRICLENLLAFGIMGMIVIYGVNPFIIFVLSKINVVVINVIAGILLVLLLIDLAISLKIISGFKNVAKSIKRDNTEEITKKVREMLINRGGLYKRLVSAFNFEASEKLIKDFTDKIKNGASKAISKLEKEKDKKIVKIDKEYDKKIKKEKRQEKKNIKKVKKGKKVDG